MVLETMMPPRSEQSRPASRARVSLGMTPTARMTRSVSMVRLLVLTLATVPSSPSMAWTISEVRTVTPFSSRCLVAMVAMDVLMKPGMI